MTVDHDVAVSAQFVNEATLSVSRPGDGMGTVTGGGIDCGETCQKPFASGSVVTLTATPAVGSTFDGWSGACTGMGSCTVTVQCDTIATARFMRSCTTTVTQSESATVFNTRLTTENATLCLADGVVITGPVVVAAKNISITRVDPTALVRFENPAGIAIEVLYPGVWLRGLEIRASNTSWATVLRIGGGAFATLESTYVECQAANGDAVLLSHGGAAMSASRIVGPSMNGTGIRSEMDSSFRLLNTTVEGRDHAIYAPRTSAYIEQSTLIASRATAVLEVQGTSSIVMSGSTLSAGGEASRFGGPVSSSMVIYLEGNMLRRRAGSTSSGSAIIAESSQILQSSVPNTFCNEGTSTTDGEFVLPLVSGTIAANSTFYNVTHVGPADCP